MKIQILAWGKGFDVVAVSSQSFKWLIAHILKRHLNIN
jgi:hypothetical protein